MTPVVVDPCAGGIPVMARRFAVGVNLGGMSVATTNENNTSGTETQFNIAELSLRYRMTRSLELELLLSGGRQALEDGSEGDLAMGGGTLALRYRFRPNRPWNWYLMAGFGVTTIERYDSTQAQRDTAQRGHFAFGVGIEHRWRVLGIHAELRGVGMGPREDDPLMDRGGTPVATPDADPRTAPNLSGGQFNIGASLYF